VTRLLLAIAFLMSMTPRLNAAIYGEDNRALVDNYSESSLRRYARSILSQLRKNSLSEVGAGASALKTKPLHQHVKNLCLDAPFAQVPTFSRCTAFLVAPDKIVTAGHCINNQKECDEAEWIFTDSLDFAETQDRKIIVPKEIQVTCKNLLAHRKNSISKNDYALIQIEQVINDRPSLIFRKEGKISTEADLLVIGHPTGLPLTSTDQAQVIDNSSDFLFKINSDTFGGNSGSPVINRETGLVEGILTDGDLDYTLDQEKGCLMPHKCDESGCKGENTVRITNIELLAPEREPLIEPIFNPRIPRL